jgi:quercetin dioxygenase-like cupin family protein
VNQPLRRVVTGIDAEGKSCVIIDGPCLPMKRLGQLVWATASHPADNSGRDDIVAPESPLALMHGGGSVFMVVEYSPGMQSYWHATDTIDYIIVLEGELVLMLEGGEVKLTAGTFVVDRGVNHAWRNDGPARAVTVGITLPARPVGQGRTV